MPTYTDNTQVILCVVCDKQKNGYHSYRRVLCKMWDLICIFVICISHMVVFFKLMRSKVSAQPLCWLTHLNNYLFYDFKWLYSDNNFPTYAVTTNCLTTMSTLTLKEQPHRWWFICFLLLCSWGIIAAKNSRLRLPRQACNLFASHHIKIKDILHFHW